MLKVGETYKIKMWEDSEDGGLITELPDCKVTEAANTLVKIQQGGRISQLSSIPRLSHSCLLNDRTDNGWAA